MKIKSYISFVLMLLISLTTFSQSITPDLNTEVCPNIEYTFSVTVPGAYSGLSTIAGCTITQTPYNLSSSSTSSTFNFKGKFLDANQTQTFKVDYTNNGAKSYNASFKRVKSLSFSSACSQISPAQPNVSAAICQAVSIPISFSNIPWSNSFESLCYGAITTYEYQLPVGWKVGTTFTSNGSNWYAGSNSVTLTSNLLGGNGAVIKVRPSNSCGSGLQNNSIPVNIGITRPNAPVLLLNGSSTVTLYCGDATAKTFIVQNPAACISSYEWVTANKGWFDINGNAITTNIITTTPTLTLKPSCNNSNPAKDIEVLMTAGTEVYSSKVTVTFSTAPPALAVSGAPEFCNSDVYTIPVSAGCGATTVWSLEPLANYPFPATLSCTNCDAVTLTKFNGGTALLRATVTFPNCNSTGIYEKYIGIGVPKFRGWYNSPTNAQQPLNPWTRANLNATNLACYATYITTSTDITANANVTWQQSGIPAGMQWYQIGNNLRFIFADINQDAFFTATITNSCGTTNVRYRFTSTGDNCSGGNPLRVQIAPNPTANDINVTLSDKTDATKQKEITIIQLVDKMGIIKQQWSYGQGSGIQTRKVNVGTLPADIYTIKVFDGSTWVSEKFVKQ